MDNQKNTKRAKDIKRATQNNVPPPYEAEKCFAIRCRSKMGEYVSREDHVFCEQMWKKYPNWYKTTEKDIFNATIPFGSVAFKK
jgi:hypothetical protein